MEDNKIINFTNRRIGSALDGLNEIKHLQDMEHLTGKDLDDAILKSVDNGDVNLSSLAKTAMALAEALDTLEHRFTTLATYVVMKLRERGLVEDNLTKKGELHEDTGDSSRQP